MATFYLDGHLADHLGDFVDDCRFYSKTDTDGLPKTELSEKNLRLKCEISTLNNLESAEAYSDQNNLVFPEGDQVVIIDNATN